MLRKSELTTPASRSIRAAIPAALVAAALGFAWGAPAQADVFNPNVPVSQADLKAKCKRSGGSWTREPNGVTRCVVHNGDSTTVVECHNGKCEGFIFDSALVQAKRKHATVGIIAPNNIVAPNNLILRKR